MEINQVALSLLMAAQDEPSVVKDFVTRYAEKLKTKYPENELKLTFDDYMDEWYFYRPGYPDEPMSPSFDNKQSAIEWARYVMIASFKTGK